MCLLAAICAGEDLFFPNSGQQKASNNFLKNSTSAVNSYDFSKEFLIFYAAINEFLGFS